MSIESYTDLVEQSREKRAALQVELRKKHEQDTDTLEEIARLEKEIECFVDEHIRSALDAFAAGKNWTPSDALKRRCGTLMCEKVIATLELLTSVKRAIDEDGDYYFNFEVMMY